MNNKHHQGMNTKSVHTPIHKSVSNKIAALENANHAFVVSSGMAAISNVLLAILKPGDHVLLTKSHWILVSMLQNI